MPCLQSKWQSWIKLMKECMAIPHIRRHQATGESGAARPMGKDDPLQKAKKIFPRFEQFIANFGPLARVFAEQHESLPPSAQAEIASLAPATGVLVICFRTRY